MKKEGKLPTAVTIKDSMIVVNIHSNRKTLSHGFLASSSAPLTAPASSSTSSPPRKFTYVPERQRGSIDTDPHCRCPWLSRTLTTRNGLTGCARFAPHWRHHRSAGHGYPVACRSEHAHAVGSAGLMFMSLAKAGINIEMISQGASEINISCGRSPS